MKSIFVEIKWCLMIKYFFLFIALIFIGSCIVQAPKYAKVENVLMLKLGMNKEEISKILVIPPYDLKAITDSTEILIYKYRVTDRKTLPFLMKPNNGIPAVGKYVDLFITYSGEGKAIHIESCSDCEQVKEKEFKVDINRLIMLLTVTAPAVLVYLGLK